MCKATLSSRARGKIKQPALRPVELSDEEVERLVSAAIRGQDAILEEDLLALITWAQGILMGMLVLDMVLAGELRPAIEGGVVKVGLPASGRPVR